MPPTPPGDQGSELPTRIGPYKVLRLLGEGGMGRVFLALDEALDRQVAIKIVRDDVAKDPEANKRFVREARAMAKLSSPHVVTIFQVGTLDDTGAPYLVMECLSGKDLAERIESEGALPTVEVARLGAQAAAGLMAAAQAKVVHRDVKPANLLLDVGPDGQLHLKLTDFGLARPLDGASHLTQEGVVVGSPFWLAPELIRGVPASHASDVYSLGATLYEALTGVVPYVRETPVAVVLAHAQEPIPPVDGPLGPLVRHMLAKEPEDRPTLAVVATELQRLHASLVGASSSVLTQAPTLEPEAPTETMEAVDPDKLRADLQREATARPEAKANANANANALEHPVASNPFDETTSSSSKSALIGIGIGAIGLIVVVIVFVALAWFSQSPAPENNQEDEAIAALSTARTCAARKAALKQLMVVGKTRSAIVAIDDAEAKDRTRCLAKRQVDAVRTAIGARLQ